MDTSGMGLAPPFTRENAGENARKATIARERNLAALREKAKLAQTPAFANSRAVAQVNKVLRWMEGEDDREEYAKLAAILDRLWNKAYPTQGAVKSRGNRDRSPVPMPEPEATKPESTG